jgi:hypothetical protein
LIPQHLIKKHALFSVVFTIAKASVYFVPLLLADVLTSYDFGVLEYALAGLGFVINALINLGVPGAYPFFLLKKKRTFYKEWFYFSPYLANITFCFKSIILLCFWA